MDPLDRLKALKLPFAELLGIEFTSADKDRVVAELTVRADLCTSPSVMHGGAIMAFADTLGAAGTILNLPPGAGTTTLESKTNFIAGAPRGAATYRRGAAGASRPADAGVDDPHHHPRGPPDRDRHPDANGP
jgi:uncharacterized protein (TIGR00369 family)